MTDELSTEYAGLAGASPSKHSARETCEDQIIVVMMRWLSSWLCRHENVHTTCD